MKTTKSISLVKFWIAEDKTAVEAVISLDVLSASDKDLKIGWKVTGVAVSIMQLKYYKTVKNYFERQYDYTPDIEALKGVVCGK